MTNGVHRILFAHASSLVGGGNKVLLHLMSHLDRGRFAPLAAIPERGPIENELRWLDVPYFRLDLRAASQSALGQAASLLRLSLRTMRFRPNLLHANELPYRTAAMAVLGAKRVCHLHHPGFGAADLKWLFRKVPDLIVTPSEYVRREVLRCLDECGLEVPVEAVWNPIDLEWFRPLPDRQAIRSRLEIDPAGSHVTILGALAPHKGHECFLRMARLVAESRPESTFHIVGSEMGRHAGYRDTLEKLAAELGVAGRVRFWGQVDNITARDLMAVSDLFVLPSLEEGFGLVLAEAQACQVPVLATAIPPLNEVVDDGTTGFLLPPNDYNALAGKALALLGSPELRLEMGRAGRRWVEERFGCERYARRISELYQQALSAGLAATTNHQST